MTRPITLKLFDGTIAPSGPITEYLTTSFFLPDGRSDSFTFLTTAVDDSADVVLGLDWLRARNPVVDWVSGYVDPRLPLNHIPVTGFTNPVLSRRATAPGRASVLITPAATAPLVPPASSPPVVPSSVQARTSKVDIQVLSDKDFSSQLKDDVLFVGSAFHIDDLVSASTGGAIPSISSAHASAARTADTTIPDLDSYLDQIPSDYHDYADVFSKARAHRLPPSRPYDHQIHLQPGTTPPYGPVYRLSELELESLREFIDENLAKGFIRPSTSPAGAPILFAKKKDGSLRLCVDFRGINNITVKDRYPLPRIDNLLDRLSRAKWFTKIDLRNGYYNVRMAEGEEWKTAWRSRYGSFEFLVLPMGLTNSPATFQHFMNDIFHDLLDRFVANYLDDIIIYDEAENLSTHVSHVREVLKRLRDNNLWAKPSKCAFHTKRIEVLGYIVTPEGISMDPAKVEVILNWAIPSSVRDVQSFVGFANFYRRFIEEYSKRTKPLTNLSKKDILFVWTPECQAAFDLLKNAFASAPILAHWNPEWQSYLESDASDYVIASILSQLNPDTGLIHPVAFYSRSMIPAELNYEIYDKELLAIFASFKEWRAYLEGSVHPVEVITDHKNLEYFNTTKVLTRRQARWSEFLSGFNYIVRYRPGRLGGKPDILTRRSDLYPKKGDGAYAVNNPQNLQTLFRDGQLLASGRATRILQPSTETSITAVLRATILDMDSIRSDILETLRSDAFASKNIPNPVHPFSLSATGLLLWNNRVYIPDARNLRLRIMQDKHDHPTAGHFGLVKTLNLVRREFYWPSLRSDISEFCNTCNECPRNKAPRHKPYGLLKQLPIPNRPWESISMDFIDQLPDSFGYDAILVIVERLTKMSLFIPCNTNITAPELAKLYVLHVFSKHGIPSDIVSDRGSEFTSNFWRSLGDTLNMKLNFSTAYHPQTDGQTERTNQTLETYLRAYVNYQQDDWSDLLPMAEFAYNNAVHSATQVSPFFANYGYHPRISISLDRSVPSAEAHDFTQDIKLLHDYVRKELASAQALYQPAADNRRLPSPDFKKGSKVWLLVKNIKLKRSCKKLGPKRLGPYEIVDLVGSNARRLKLPKNLKRIHPVFHVSLLEEHRPNRIPGRVVPPPPPDEIEGEEQYTVSAILDSRRYHKKLQYLVQWMGYENTAESSTWEPAENVADSEELVTAFHQAYPKKPRPPDLVL